MVHLHLPQAAVGYFGVAVNVGSRDEDASVFGLAHFVEHTIFKGTDTHRSSYIINRMEAVGGELNAYTSKEETVVYSTFPAGHHARAMTLIADLVANSCFPQRELNKEREVVADEIDSYLDSPADAVFDDFDDLLFLGHGLGHNILGTREALATFTPEVCRRYLQNWYTLDNIVLFYAGDLPADKFFRLGERLFHDLPATGKRPDRNTPVSVETFDKVVQIPSHQAHTVMGTRICSLYSPERYSYALLGNILGGPGMNSLLNVSLRERHGLVYSVEASTSFYTDCGSLTIYFGCDPSDTLRCRRLVDKTLERVASGFLTPKRLEAAVTQYMGQRIIALDNAENRILALAREFLLTGRPIIPGQATEALRAITRDDMARTAADLRLSTLTYQPE